MSRLEDAAQLVLIKLRKRGGGSPPSAVVAQALVGKDDKLVITGEDLKALLPVLQSLANMPTSDPHIAGQLWNNGGIPSISQG